MFADTYIRLIKWWSELFGLDTPEAVTTVAAVVAGILLVGVFKVILSACLGFVRGAIG